ncbi:hypothetical protein [Longispora urticae]
MGVSDPQVMGNKPGEALGSKKNMPLGDELDESTDIDTAAGGMEQRQVGAGAGRTATQARQQTGQQTAGTTPTTRDDKGKSQPPSGGRR